jgi:glutathione S-transferase
MSDLTIYGFAGSTYVKTVLMACAESRAQPELRPLEFHTPAHLELHPYGKMPILEHGDVRLFETLAILSYVGATFEGSHLWPSAPAEGALALQWASVGIDYAYPALVKALLGDESISPEVAAEAGRQLKLLDAGLGSRSYFAGPSISVADLVLYPMVEYAAKRLGKGELPGLPSIERWRAAMSDRPSIAKAA